MALVKVSVVIPTHNRRGWLRATLRSVLQQQNVDLEAIIVDDGSTDDTLEMLVAVSDPRVRIIHHDSPRGVSASRNDGAAEARGEWVAFVDDDDLRAPEKVSRQVEAGIATGRRWVYTGSVNIDEQMRIVGGRPPAPPEDVTRLIARHNVIPGGGSNVIVRRDEFERVGPFDLRLKNTEDWELWIRLAERGHPAWVPRPLMAYRVHTGNASLDVRAILEGVSLIERQHGTMADHGIIHRWIGELCLRTGHRNQAVKHLAIAALRGQAVDVAGDVAAIIRRRLGATQPASQYREWIEQARDWLEDLSHV
jgi:glycosyltransferase involved in cell wall biosynthesis